MAHARLDAIRSFELHFSFEPTMDVDKPFKDGDTYTIEVEQKGHRVTFVGVPTSDNNGKARLHLSEADYYEVRRIG